MTTPYFIIDADRIEENLRVLRGIMDRTGCKILLAQKCFSCYALYPMIGQYLSGMTASGLYEARLCHEEMKGGENHVFSPAFRQADMDELVKICNHIVFNSPRQLLLYGRQARDAGVHVGLRVNPECSTQEGHAIYDPCAPGSRLGTTVGQFADAFFGDDEAFREAYTWLDGLHFHTLCEQNSDDLETTLDALEERFGKYLHGMKWLNFGGGHHITRADYDIQRLERCIRRMQERYDLQVYLEPGEAVALNAGELHATVLEVQPRGADGISNVILDTSAACHMPDVIEMPYTPPLLHPEPVADAAESTLAPAERPADAAEQLLYHYRFGGPTCLSGDVIGRYTLSAPLHEGDEVVFGDMAIYSMVKTNTFNGMPLPDIYISRGQTASLWKHFDYHDFKNRV